MFQIVFVFSNYRNQVGFLAKDFLNLLGGVVLFFCGVLMYFEGFYWNWGTYVPVSKGTAFILIAFGLLLLRAGYKEMIKTARDVVKYLKCPACGHVCYSHEAPGLKCPKCSGTVESLEGFFERHPELKENEPKKNCRHAMFR